VTNSTVVLNRAENLGRQRTPFRPGRKRVRFAIKGCTNSSQGWASRDNDDPDGWAKGQVRSPWSGT
jgi:hypothetical protein